MTLFVVDFETRSRVNIDYTNAVKYARDLSTEVICLSYGEADDYEATRKLWTPEQPFPFLSYHECTFAAFNAEFEISIWNECCTRRYNWPRLDPENIQCLMAAASYAGLPRNLKDVANTLGLPAKDADGHAVMMYCTRPVGANCNNDGAWIGGEYDRDPAKLQRVGKYCLQDGTVESRISTYAPPISPLEQQIWQANYDINMRGIPIDRRMCETAMWMVRHEQDRLQLELKRRTNGQIETVGQTLALVKWLKEQKVDVPNVRKETLDELDRSALSENVTRVLEIRRLARDAAVAKYQGMLCHAEADDRCRCAHIYYKAGTGRFQGSGVNFLNLRRLNDDEVADEIMLADRVSACSDKDRINLFVKLQGTQLGVIPTLGKMIRLAIKAAPGKKLIVRDYSAIEMNVLHWLANDEAMLEIIRRFYAGVGEEPYKLAAARMYHVPVTEVNRKQRQAGKVYYLGCGYCSGGKKLLGFAKNYGISMELEEALAMVKDYRISNPLVTNLWNRYWKTALKAVREPGYEYEVLGTTFRVNGSTLRIRLRSGRELCYYRPRIVDGLYGDEIECVDIHKHKVRNQTRRLGIATLIENCIAEDTLVLTNFGWKRIQDVKYSDRVWDGLEWCDHDGVVYSGTQATIELNGVRMTPDHKVLINGKWQKAKDVKTGRPLQASDLLGVAINDRQMPAALAPSVEKLRRAWDQSVQTLESIRELPGRHGTVVYTGIMLGPNGQRRELHTGQLSMDDLYAAKQKQTEQCQATDPVGANYYAGSRGTIGNRKTDSAIQACTRMAGSSDIDAAECTQPVYDIRNCGPRHRFAVRGPGGDILIVHNCDQAISRDLLCDALLRARTENIPVILSVYDEIVAEVDDNDDNSVNVLKQIMTDPPAWARGLPIDVKGGESQRYTK